MIFTIYKIFSASPHLHRIHIHIHNQSSILRLPLHLVDAIPEQLLYLGNGFGALHLQYEAQQEAVLDAVNGGLFGPKNAVAKDGAKAVA
jgi:hypothetical protein